MEGRPPRGLRFDGSADIELPSEAVVLHYSIIGENSKEVGTVHIVGETLSAWATEMNDTPATWTLNNTVATVTPELSGDYSLRYQLIIL